MLNLLPGCIFPHLMAKEPHHTQFLWPDSFSDAVETNDRSTVPLWSPVTYHPGKQREAGFTEVNIHALYALSLDFDGKQGVFVPIDRAMEILHTYEAAIHTTYNHTEDNHRFRFIVPFSRKVTTQEFRRIWAFVARRFTDADARFDPLSDPGRMYYVPSHRVGAPFRFIHRKGPLLDPDEVLKDAPLLSEVYTPSAARSTGSGSSVVQRVFAPRTGEGTGLFAGIETANQTENLDRIEEQCAFMRHCREDASTLTEPEWYAWLSILARCKDGETHAHEIGKAHEGYRYAETAEKFHRAATETGPRTCAAIREMCASCEGCPLGAPIGNITSPVMLGRPNPETATVEELREDAVTRSESDVERARATVAAAEAQVAALAIEESVARTRANYARRFGAEDAIRTEVAAHVAATDNLRAAREQVKIAKNVLRAAETRANRTAALTQADPRVVNDLALDARTGVPRSSIANIITILRGDSAYSGAYFRYDEFAQRLYYGSDLAADHIDTTINEDIERRYNLVSRTQLIQESIVSLARLNTFHPVRDWLNGLEWDGQARLQDVFTKGFGAVGTVPYVQDAAVKFLVGAVARVIKPGCKLDEMVVLVGKQGARKSTGLRVLANGWFADSNLPVGDKDSYLLLIGKWLYEVAELDSFKKAENTRIKAFLSSQVDYFRPPFGRHTVECPRQTVIVGSTNERQFLNDPTGSRRFVPIRVTKVDVPWLEENVAQIWAEAVVHYKAGTKYWYDGESAERLAQESIPFQQEDVWTQPVYEYVVRRKTSTVAVNDVLTAGLGMDFTRISRFDKSRVIHILEHFGCEIHSDTALRGMVYSVPESMQNVTLMEKPETKGHPLPRWASEKPPAAPSTPHPEGPLY